MEVANTLAMTPQPAESNGHTNETAVQNVVLHEEPPADSSTLQQTPHPLAKYFGKFEGEVWEEVRAIIQRNREQDDREAAGD